MTNVSYKAANRSNTLCIARFDNAGNDICHRKFELREVFSGSLNFELNRRMPNGTYGGVRERFIPP
ncbi:MAG: hypothetical protein IJN43_14825, partial [Ruminococcus sp.]|nr:hypothetical protein [Ruminococcus sp.]